MPIASTTNNPRWVNGRMYEACSCEPRVTRSGERRETTAASSSQGRPPFLLHQPRGVSRRFRYEDPGARRTTAPEPDASASRLIGESAARR
jgi:hypothetical protein